MKVTRAISTIAMTLKGETRDRVQRVKEHANLNAPATIVEEESIEPSDTTVDVSAVVTAEDTGSH
jgi:hypothetical protein